MPRPRAGERVLGPFPKWGDRAKAIPWTGRSRIIHVHPGRLNDKGSEETPFYFATRAEALEAKQRLEGLTEEATRTVAQAIEKFLAYLAENEREKKTIEGYEWALGRMFPNADRIPLAHLAKPEHCQLLYTRLRKDRAQTRGRKPAKGAPARPAPVRALATDTHRNILVMSRSFVKWCCDFPQTLIKKNGFVPVKGMGKRKRGKVKLTIDEARKFLVVCITMANAGDQGAVAAMVTLLLGMRATEVASRLVRDVDDRCTKMRLMQVAALDQRTKTEEECTKEIPEMLRPYLRALCRDKAATASLWDYTRNGSGWAAGKILEQLAISAVPLDVATLAERSGVGYASTSTIVLRMCKAKQVARAGRGLYRAATGTALAVRRVTPASWKPKRHWVLRSVRRMCEQAGVVVVTAHSMRGLQATLATIGGIKELLKKVAQDIGHDSERTTIDHYIDPRALAGETQRRANDLLLEGLLPQGEQGEQTRTGSNSEPTTLVHPGSISSGNETPGIIPAPPRGRGAN